MVPSKLTNSEGTTTWMEKQHKCHGFCDLPCPASAMFHTGLVKNMEPMEPVFWDDSWSHHVLIEWHHVEMFNNYWLFFSHRSIIKYTIMSLTSNIFTDISYNKNHCLYINHRNGDIINHYKPSLNKSSISQYISPFWRVAMVCTPYGYRSPNGVCVHHLSCNAIINLTTNNQRWHPVAN